MPQLQNEKEAKGIFYRLRKTSIDTRNILLDLKSELGILSIIQKNLKKLDRKVDLLSQDISFIRTNISSYLGGGVALTYLVDGTPIYVNSNDMGSPSNFLHGGV